jgi:O-antigen/teichoic acid export membrane protein
MPVHKRNRKIFASAGFGVFQRLVQAGCTLLVMPRLLGVLGAANFGVWGAVTSLAWVTGLVDIGTGSALVTMVAHSIALNDIGEARSRITKGLTIGTGLAALILLLAFVAWMCGVMRGEAGPYLIALVALTINIPLHSSNNVFMALQKGYISGFWELVQTLLTTVALFVAFGLTKDVRVYVAVVYGALLASNLGSLIHLFVLHPELRPRALPESLASLREIGESGMLFFVLGITGSLSFMLDNVLALQFLGPEASALMTIAMRICMTAIGMLAVLSQPLWPAFADAAHKADRAWIRRGLFRGTALLVGATVAGSAILVLFGEQLLRLWLHGGLGIGLPLLWAISAWVVSQALVRIPTLLLNGLLLIRFQIGVFSVATVVALTLKFLLAPYLGVGGILWGTTIAVLLIAFPASAWRIYRWSRQPATPAELSSRMDPGGERVARPQF